MPQVVIDDAIEIPAEVDRALAVIAPLWPDVPVPVDVEHAYEIGANLVPYMRALAAYRAWLYSICEADLRQRGGTARRVKGIEYGFEDAGPAPWLIEDKQGMLTALAELVGRDEIGSTEFEAAVNVETPEPVIKIDNGKLNRLLKKYGQPVADVVERFRQRGMPSPPKFYVREAK